MLEEEKAWEDMKGIPSAFSSKNRYLIVSTEIFGEDIGPALEYIKSNWQDFRFRKKSVGALILSSDTYLFFTYTLPKDDSNV
jgi:hypothetical protein